MFFSIDATNGIPIYEQILRQVIFAIAEGTLRDGQLLPSVRTLSIQLALNPSTIARAYQHLQTEGILEPLRGRGLIVCQGAARICKEDRRAIIADRLESVLKEALHGGLEASEIEALIKKKLKQLVSAVNTIASDLPNEAVS